MTLREMAEEHAQVKFEGLNHMGHPMYSSESYGALMSREVKMASFEAGLRKGLEIGAHIADDVSNSLADDDESILEAQRDTAITIRNCIMLRTANPETPPGACL